MGLPAENAILCDTKGVIYKGRKEGLNQWKSAHAVDTDARTLADALKGADVFLGLSVKGAMTEEMVRAWLTIQLFLPWQIRTGDYARRSCRHSRRCDYRNRSVGLSQSGE